MKKLITFCLVMTFVLGSMTYATDTRLQTMGMGDLRFMYEGSHMTTNHVVKDVANIWLYPSLINNYPNLFTAEITGSYYYYYSKQEADFPLYKVGAHFQAGGEEAPFVIGTYFSIMPYHHSIAPFSTPGDFFFEDRNQRINFFYGRNLGDIPFGFQFGMYSSSEKNEDAEETFNDEEALSRYEFSFGISPMQGKLDLAAGVAMTSWTDKDYNGSAASIVDITEADGNMAFFFRGRYWMDPMDKFTFVPHFAFMMDKQGRKNNFWDGSSWTLNNTLEYKTTVFDLGIGMNYDANEDILVAGDFGFAMASETDERIYADDAFGTGWKDEYKLTALPYFRLGLDAYVFKWLDIRCGVASLWIKDVYEYNDPEDADNNEKRTDNVPHTETFFGAGFHWGNLEIDASIDPEFLTNGPYFITGEDTDDIYDGWSGKVTVLYNFD